MLARKPIVAFGEVDVVDVTPSTPAARAGSLGYLGQQHQQPEDSRSFVALDALIAARAGVGGLVLVTATSIESAEAVGDHAVRRLAGARMVRASGGAAGEAWREAARALQPHAGDAMVAGRDVAQAIVQSLSDESLSAVVVCDSEASRFSLSVAVEIDAALAAAGAETTESSKLVLWIVANESADRIAASLPHARVFEVEAALDRAGVAAWWDAARADAPSVEAAIQSLEQWWRGARSSASRDQDAPEHLARARMLLSMAGRPWPVASIAALGVSQEEVRELVVAGIADVRDGAAVVLRAPVDIRAGAPSDAGQVASVLEATFSGDPWSMLRAAELCYLQGDPSGTQRGDALALHAVGAAIDADSRIDLWTKFDAATPSPSPGAERLLPFVDLALRKGDGDWALKFARDAVAAAPNADGSVLLALGRALAVSGDLTSATITLEKITTAANQGVEQRLIAAKACVELAEARYYASDLPRARSSADDALVRLEELLVTDAGPGGRACASVRLDARNVQGKLLLAQGDFVAAEHHFASDAFEASLVNQPVSELRARVNRAIAVMSLGRRAEAQNLLESVLVEAERAAELKATGMCLINLAALAIIDRRYGEALELSERAVEVLRRIGDKVALSRCVANLAELRARIGLIEEAAQAVRFGARVLRGGMPPEQAARFALVLARVALSKGDSSGAQRHVTQALASLGVSMNVDTASTGPRGPVAEHVSEALRFAARIALEDGDTARAKVLIDRAAAERAPQRARSEVAVLRALLCRAMGESFDAPASEALRAARDADDDEMAREAHLLLYRAAMDEGATSVAKHHLTSALALRDRMAEGIPAPLRAGFLQRRDFVQLELEAQAFEQSSSSGRDAMLPSGSMFPSEPRASLPAPSISYVPPPGGRRIVGDDPGIRALLNAVKKVGPADAIVLIHGESGTGKELVAEALHEASTRKAGPLVKVNCAALVETLLLSELFGHEKGAFTGAAGRRRGRFEAAEGGTLFLDEIGDISPRTQVALLRVLQEKTFERVGGTTQIRANVRVVCATHRNLKALVARGEFREDLYYRLCGVTLEVPALRSRLGDLPALCDAILRRIAEERGGTVKRLSPPALSALKAHTWPGNIRELENGLRAASLFAEGDVLEVHDFSDNVESLRHISETVEVLSAGGPMSSIPPTMSGDAITALSSRFQSQPPSGGPETARAEGMGSGSSIGAPGAASAAAPSIPGGTPSEVAYAQVRSGVSLHDMKRLIERECIVRALGEAGGNITKAATLLGMKRPRLSQLVKQYGLGGGDASDEGVDATGTDTTGSEEEE